MPVTKSLGTVVAAAARQTGIPTPASGARHTDSDVLEEVNSSYQESLEMLVERNFTEFLEETSPTPLPSSPPVTGERYVLIDWPTNAAVIRRIDVLVNGQWDKLTEVDWANLPDVVQRTSTPSAERPLYFATKSIGSVSGTALTAGKIALAPISNQGGTYKLTYLPQATVLSDNTHLFLYLNEHHYRWHIWSTVEKLADRDRNKGKRAETAEKRMARYAEKIGRQTAKTVGTSGGGMHRAHNYWG